ncbi:MAG: hypothetical protein ACXWT0_01670 [Methylobacter sp.]
MSVVRIIDQGWDSFTGDLGGIEFIDGVSVRALTDREISRLGAGMRVESVESGLQLGIGAQLAAAVNDPMVAESYGLGSEEVLEDAVANVAPAQPGPAYTREQLEAIADTGGIVELRKVAETMGVKGKSIAQLIDGVLEAGQRAG